ncbi:MAG: hypothetical protein RL188_1189 [Bacteroidota bacterium]|jgi:hypothetical protein
MHKKWIGYALLFVLATQVFPVDGIRFWSNLMQSNTQTSTHLVLAMEEEEVEEIQLKLKNVESNHSLYFESQDGLLSSQAVHAIISKMGNAIDRNEPILVPPPKQTI